MHILGLILLGILTGAFGSEEICRYKAHHYQNCRALTVRPSTLPVNEKELQDVCNNLKKFELCVSNYMSSCSPLEKSEEVLGNMSEPERKFEIERIHLRLQTDQKDIELVTEVCRKDSELRANLIPVLACLKETEDIYFNERPCKNYTKDALNYLASDFDKIRQDTGEKYLSQPYCMENLFDMNCFVEQFNSKCNPAPDLAPELLKRAFVVENFCPVYLRSDILRLLDTWQTETKKEFYVRNLVETD